jgi:hypothetical protein
MKVQDIPSLRDSFRLVPRRPKVDPRSLPLSPPPGGNGTPDPGCVIWLQNSKELGWSILMFFFLREAEEGTHLLGCFFFLGREKKGVCERQGRKRSRVRGVMPGGPRLLNTGAAHLGDVRPSTPWRTPGHTATHHYRITGAIRELQPKKKPLLTR